jgi:hypothetical protein
MENTKIFDILRRTRVEGYYRYIDDIHIIYDENHTNIEEVQKSVDSTTGLHFTWNGKKTKN